MLKPSTALCGILLISTPVFAQQLTVSIGAFGDPADFMITEGSNLSLRVTELVPAPGANNSTHVLVEGLSPLEADSMVYASPYRGINSTTGDEQDVGVLYLEMPEAAALPAGTVSSPIVGVLQRAGPWSAQGLTVPTTSIGGASGVSSYNSGAMTMSLTLERGAETFTGTTSYSVVDTNSLEVEPFTLVKDGATSYQLSGATLMRDGGRFYGTLTNQSAGAGYDSLLFSVELTNIPDVDMDGIPDIVDDSIEAVELVPGEWVRLPIGLVYGITDTMGISDELGVVYTGHMPFYYAFGASGWVTAHQYTGDGHWLHHMDKGWIYVLEGAGGWYWGFPTGSGEGAWNHFLQPTW
jgi:hypothetical protein